MKPRRSTARIRFPTGKQPPHRSERIDIRTSILVVDDEVVILNMVSALLRGKGYDIQTARNGEEASTLLRSGEHFDLMISDIRMQPVDGLQLLKLAQDELPSMPVIMITAYGTQETATKASEMGAFDFLPKPFRTDELLSIVRKALEHEGT